MHGQRKDFVGEPFRPGKFEMTQTQRFLMVNRDGIGYQVLDAVFPQVVRKLVPAFGSNNIVLKHVKVTAAGCRCRGELDFGHIREALLIKAGNLAPPLDPSRQVLQLDDL